MTTIRRRLTTWYTVALGVTVVAFGTLLYLERRQSSIRELDQRLGLEAELANRWLSESYNVLGRIVTAAGLNPALDPGISAYLEAVRDYLVVADTNGRILALSEAARSLPAADLERLQSAARFARRSQALRHHRPGPAGRSGAGTSRCESEMPAPSSAVSSWPRRQARWRSGRRSSSGRCSSSLPSS